MLVLLELGLEALQSGKVCVWPTCYFLADYEDCLSFLLSSVSLLRSFQTTTFSIACLLVLLPGSLVMPAFSLTSPALNPLLWVGLRLDRHAQVAISKETAKLSKVIMKSFAKKELRSTFGYQPFLNAILRSNLMFSLWKLYSWPWLGLSLGEKNPGGHNPQACYDLNNRVRSRIRMLDVDSDGLNGALSIHQRVIGVSSGRETYYCIICKHEGTPQYRPRLWAH